MSYSLRVTPEEQEERNRLAAEAEMDAFEKGGHPAVDRGQAYNLQQIAQELSRKDINEPIKPLKWNNYETRSKKEILEAERESILKNSPTREATADATPYSESGSVNKEALSREMAAWEMDQYDSSTRVNRDQALAEMDVFDSTYDPGDPGSLGAGIRGAAQDAVTGTLTLVGKGVIQPALLIGNQIASLGGGDGKFDPEIAAVDKTIEESRSLLVTPEEQAQRGFGSKAMGALGGILPAFAAGPLGAPVMAASAYMDTGTDALREGVSLADAQLGAASQSAAAYLGAKIPATFGPKNVKPGAWEYTKSLMPSVAAGATVNPITGAMADYATGEVFKDSANPELAEKYRWDNLEQRAIEAVTGAATGGVFRAWEVKTNEVRRKKNEELLKNYLEENEKTMTGLQDIADNTDWFQNVHKEDPANGYTIEKILTNPDAPNKPTSREIIDLSIQYLRRKAQEVAARGDEALHHNDERQPVKNFTPQDLQTIAANAEILQRLLVHLQLQDVKVDHGDKNRYRFLDDTIELKKDQAGLEDPNSTEMLGRVVSAIHEVKHALTRGAFNWYEGVKSGHITLTKKEIPLMEAMRQAHDLYDLTLERTAKKENLSKEDFLKKLEGLITKKEGKTVEDWNWAREHYFLRNVDEFFSDVGVGRHGDTILKEIELPAENRSNRKAGFQHYDASNTFLHNTTAAMWDTVLGRTREQNTYSAYDAWVHSNAKLVDAMDKIGSRHFESLLETSSGKLVTMSPYKRRWRDRTKEKMKGKARQALDANPALDYLTTRLRSSLMEATSLDEFKTKLGLEFVGDKNWAKWVEANGERLWVNAPHVIDTIGRRPKTEHTYWEQENRTTAEFMADEIYQAKLKGKQDIGLLGGLRFGLGGDQANLLLTKGTLAERISQHYMNKAQQYNKYEEILYHQLHEEANPYWDLGLRDKLRVVQARAFWDKNSKFLASVGKQWPDKRMLMRGGLNDVQAEAYLSLTRMLDGAWNLLEQARKKIDPNSKPITRRAGYMEHIWPDPYKVLINAKYKTVTGKEGEYTIFTNGFKTRQGAENWLKQNFLRSTTLEEKFKAMGLNPAEYPDVKSFSINPDPHTGNHVRILRNMDISQLGMQALMDEIGHFHKAFGIENADTLANVQRIDEDISRGFTKHRLESENVRGFLGHKGTYKGLLDLIGIPLNMGKNARMMASPENYLKSVTEYWKNTMFLADVHAPIMKKTQGDTHAELGTIGKPLFGNELNNLTELYKWLNDQALNITGANKNELAFLDNMIQSISIKVGIDPYAYKRTVRFMRNLLSMVAIRSPHNFIANAFQFTNAIGIMHYVAADLQSRPGMGLSKTFSSPTAIMAKVMSPGYKMSKATANAVQRAESQRILEAQMESQARVGAQGSFDKALMGTINPTIEKWGRQYVFIMGFEYGMKLYNGDQNKAFYVAKKIMDLTMVNYDRSNRPLMYQNLGIVGESMSPFAVFRNAFLGNFLAMFKMAVQNPTKLYAWKPMLSQLMTTALTAGALGVPLASEYDVLVGLYNSIVGGEEPWPTWNELVLSWGLPRAATWGMVSYATQAIPGLENGINVSQSMNAVGISDLSAMPLVPFTVAMADIVGKTAKSGGKWAAGGFEEYEPPNVREMYSSLRTVAPKPVIPYLLERAVSTDSLMGLDNKLQAEYRRDPEDRRAFIFTGKYSIDETEERSVNRELKMRQKYETEQMNRIVKKLTHNFMTGEAVYDEAPLYEQALLMGVSADEVKSKVMKSVLASQIPYQDRRRQATKNPKETALRLKLEGELNDGLASDNND